MKKKPRIGDAVWFVKKDYTRCLFIGLSHNAPVLVVHPRPLILRQKNSAAHKIPYVCTGKYAYYIKSDKTYCVFLTKREAEQHARQYNLTLITQLKDAIKKLELLV